MQSRAATAWCRAELLAHREDARRVAFSSFMRASLATPAGLPIDERPSEEHRRAPRRREFFTLQQSRRHTVLTMLKVGVCALICRTAGAVSTAERSWSEAPRERLSALLSAVLSEQAGARMLGRRYLASCPTAARQALELANWLSAEQPASVLELRRLLAEIRDEDARLRRTALVDGWVLLRVEAQVCALAVLI